MVSKSALMVFNAVALRKESVDRNLANIYETVNRNRVALRKESVDRNCLYAAELLYLRTVALRKESVDRNARSISAIPTP